METKVCEIFEKQIKDLEIDSKPKSLLPFTCPKESYSNSSLTTNLSSNSSKLFIIIIYFINKK